MDRKRGEEQRIWRSLPGRFRRGSLVAVATLLIGWSAAWSQTPPPARLSAGSSNVLPSPNTDKPVKTRLREGTELHDAHGYFRFVEDRVVFFQSDGDARYTGLENLNLERIVSEITNNPTQLEWTIVGTITEYHGTNYLLVRRAVLSRAAPDFKAPPSALAPKSASNEAGSGPGSPK